MVYAMSIIKFAKTSIIEPISTNAVRTGKSRWKIASSDKRETPGIPYINSTIRDPPKIPARVNPISVSIGKRALRAMWR